MNANPVIGSPLNHDVDPAVGHGATCDWPTRGLPSDGASTMESGSSPATCGAVRRPAAATPTSGVTPPEEPALRWVGRLATANV